MELFLVSLPGWIPGTILALALVFGLATAKAYRDLRRMRAARRRLDAKYPSKPPAPPA